MPFIIDDIMMALAALGSASATAAPVAGPAVGAGVGAGAGAGAGAVTGGLAGTAVGTGVGAGGGVVGGGGLVGATGGVVAGGGAPGIAGGLAAPALESLSVTAAPGLWGSGAGIGAPGMLGGGAVAGGGAGMGMNALDLPGATFKEAGMYPESVQSQPGDAVTGDQSWWRQKLTDYDAYMEDNPKTAFGVKRGLPALGAGFESTPGETEVSNVGDPTAPQQRQAPSASVGMSGRMPSMGAGRIPYSGPGSGMRRQRRPMYRR